MCGHQSFGKGEVDSSILSSSTSSLHKKQSLRSLRPCKAEAHLSPFIFS
ncbi:hypothetical protein predicted by Glimmer/Critica [Acetobacter senegalensis]|uniref:Uncharacterized protein n=1 Tax=Acetobacter senegalensis TaxID=446692 RepID=A0A0U5EZG7_9PROT|nr:hypothetical protein predicted by Glimmer/Critica [Acetobacter senegalensis]